jgi:hypothetical protein
VEGCGKSGKTGAGENKSLTKRARQRMLQDVCPRFLPAFRLNVPTGSVSGIGILQQLAGLGYGRQEGGNE